MPYLDLDLLENPYGKRIGGGYDTVRVGDGGRLHVRGPDNGPLCMQGRRTTDLRASEGRVVDCYRCIKIMGMNANAPYIRRELTTAKGDKRSHYMVPGGRQGQLVADKKSSPSGMSGVAPFKRGPTNHPTQPWMTKRLAMAKTYEERLSDEGVALPPYYLPPTPEEVAAAQEVSFYESPKAKRRAAAERRRGAAAAAAAKVANPRHARHGLPYMTFGNPSVWEWAVMAGSVEGEGIATSRKEAAASLGKFLSAHGLTGQFSETTSDAVEMYSVFSSGGRPVGAASIEPLTKTRARSGKRKAMSESQHDAQHAMSLFHSGTFGTLKEAWAYVKQQSRRANGRRR